MLHDSPERATASLVLTVAVVAVVNSKRLSLLLLVCFHGKLRKLHKLIVVALADVYCSASDFSR